MAYRNGRDRGGRGGGRVGLGDERGHRERHFRGGGSRNQGGYQHARGRNGGGENGGRYNRQGPNALETDKRNKTEDPPVGKRCFLIYLRALLRTLAHFVPPEWAKHLRLIDQVIQGLAVVG